MRYALVSAVTFAILSCGGSAGPQGATGSQGPAGPAGLGVVSARFCSGQSVAFGAINLLFEYQVVKYTNGDAELHCLVADGRASTEASFYCRSTSACATAGEQCEVGYDVDDPNSGFLEFRNDTPGERVIYHDTGS